MDESEKISPAETPETPDVPETPETPDVTGAEATTEETPAESAATGRQEKPITVERVVDIAFGFAVVAAEAIEKAARAVDGNVRNVVTDTPAYLDAIEEKGRPIRERLKENLKGAPSVGDAFEAAAEKTATTAADELDALELRAKELEKKLGVAADDVAETVKETVGDAVETVSDAVSPDAASGEKTPFSMLELDDAPAGTSASESKTRGKKAKTDSAGGESEVPTGGGDI